MNNNNQWTGGQYSLFRALFGTYLFVHFAHLAPWSAESFSNTGVLADGSASPFLKLFPNILAVADSPMFVTLFVVSAAVAAVFFLVGKGDRIAALWMWYVLACLFGRNPLTANPSLPFVGWILLVHLFIPSAPYGSVKAKERPDPDGGWQFPAPLFTAAWVLMALTYSYSGYTKMISPSWVDGTALGEIMQNPLARETPLRHMMLALPPILLKLGTWGGLAAELLFAPLALFRRLRPFLWFGLLFMHLSLIALIDFADLSIGMVILHLFTFNPAWLKPKGDESGTVVFYDGVCGLCHRMVRLILAEDRSARFRFAALQSDALAAAIPDEAQRQALPDSIVVVTADKTVLLESTAVAHILTGLGGYWRVLGTALRLVPRPLRDTGYRCVARVRARLFSKPADVCPLIPPHLRERFLA